MGVFSGIKTKEKFEEKFAPPPGYVHPANRRRIVKSFDRLSRPYQWGTNQAMAEVVKALATSALSGFGDATPIRLENLDTTMTSVLFQEDHLKLLNAIPRVPAKQIVFQWLRRISYGTQRNNRGFKEGGVPTGGVSSWRRGTGTVKYLGVRRGYTHQMVMVGQQGGSFVDPVVDENRAGTLELLGGLERDVNFGQSVIGDGSNNIVNYDGLYTQLANSSFANVNIIDKQNQPIDFEDLENIGQQFVTRGKLFNFNNIRSFFNPQALSDLAKLKLQAERRLLNDMTVGYRPGVPLEGFRTQHGYLPFEESIFMDPVEDGGVQVNDQGVAIGDSGAPASPVITSATPSATGGNMPSGAYYYFISAINDSGESLTTASGLVTVVGPTGSVAIVIAATAGATGYRIYRGTVNSATDPSVALIATVAAGAPLGIATVGTAGSGATVTDTNSVIPGTTQAIIGNFAEEDMALAQLAPLIKFPLAVVSTTQEFLLILYHVPLLKAPERLIWIKNIGRRLP